MLNKVENISHRTYYQKFLYKHGKLIGIWQRQNLGHYGSLASVRLDKEDKVIKFEHLIPTKSDVSDFIRKPFLTISIDGNEEIKTMFEDALGTRFAKIEHDTNESELNVTILHGHLQTTTEKQKILDEFGIWETGFGKRDTE